MGSRLASLSGDMGRPSRRRASCRSQRSQSCVWLPAPTPNAVRNLGQPKTTDSCHEDFPDLLRSQRPLYSECSTSPSQRTKHTHPHLLHIMTVSPMKLRWSSGPLTRQTEGSGHFPTVACCHCPRAFFADLFAGFSSITARWTTMLEEISLTEC